MFLYLKELLFTIGCFDSYLPSDYLIKFFYLWGKNGIPCFEWCQNFNFIAKD